MSADLIGIENDQSQIIIDRETKELSHKGVLLFDQDETLDSISVTYQGLGISGRQRTHYLSPA